MVFRREGGISSSPHRRPRSSASSAGQLNDEEQQNNTNNGSHFHRSRLERGHNNSHVAPNGGQFESLLQCKRWRLLDFGSLLYLFRIIYLKLKRLRWYALCPLILGVATVVVVSLGTVYSRMTAEDACKILASALKQRAASSNTFSMPRLFHYQSRTSILSEETQTWRNLLQMKEVESQIYPNVWARDDGWRSVYWSDEACIALVREHFPSFLPVYENFSHNIQRVDSCRYLILYQYGGVYADTDISFHSNATTLEQLLPRGVGLVESPYRYNEHWQNSLMSATVARHPFWKLVVDIMTERRDSEAVLTSTGPSMIGDAVQRWERRRHNAVDEHFDYGVHTLPCELFQRLPSGDWDTTLLNILGREILARAIPMKGCGVYANGKCEITRHRGRASWTNVGGTLV